MRCTANCYKSNGDLHKYFILKKIEEEYKRQKTYKRKSKGNKKQRNEKTKEKIQKKK